MNPMKHLTAIILSLLAATAAAQLPSTIDLNVTPGTESADVIRVYGDDDQDWLGTGHASGIAFGDWNSDGFDDAIIGAIHADPPGGNRAGEAIIIWGSATLTASAEIDLNSAIGSNGETRILGDDAEDIGGYSVASGDVNGDGTEDVIVTLVVGGPTGRSAAGEVVVVWGNTSLPGSAEIDLNSTPGSNGETRIYGDDTNDNLGWSAAIGDVNGDGLDDMILGAINADPPGGSQAGEVIVVYGSPSLPASAEVDLDITPGGRGETRILGDDGMDLLGKAVTSGDVNGDGFDDVIIGADLATPSGGSRAGEVVIVYGSASLPTAVIDLDFTPGSNGETRIYGDDENDYLGRCLACGDVNGDGLDDVVISANYADAPGRVDSGEVVVIYGSASLPSTAVIDLNSTPGSNGETRILGDDADDGLGDSVACGDINSDGFDDLIMAAQDADPPAGSEAGEVVVIYGSASLPSSSQIDLGSVSGDVLVQADNQGDWLGSGLATGGDINRDGFPEFAVSADDGDNPSLGADNDSGVAYVICGDGVAPSASVSRFTRTGDGAGGDVVPPDDFGPGVRCVIDFSDDDSADNGSGGASQTTVALTRSTGGVVNLSPLSGVASSVWEITTDRTGWTSADVTLRYTDAEVAGIPGLVEDDLVIFKAPTLTGPWAQVTTSVDTARNEVTAAVSSFSHFAIVDGNTVIPVELSVFTTD
jgi:FG-GAP repeat protein